MEYADKTNTVVSPTLPWSHCEKSCPGIPGIKRCPCSSTKTPTSPACRNGQPDPSQLLQALRRRNISKAINQTQAQEGEGSSSQPRRGDGQAAVGPAEHQCPAGTANVTRGHFHELPFGEGWLWSSFYPGNHTWSGWGGLGDAAGQEHVGSAARGP